MFAVNLSEFMADVTSISIQIKKIYVRSYYKNI